MGLVANNKIKEPQVRNSLQHLERMGKQIQTTREWIGHAQGHEEWIPKRDATWAGQYAAHVKPILENATDLIEEAKKLTHF